MKLFVGRIHDILLRYQISHPTLCRPNKVKYMGQVFGFTSLNALKVFSSIIFHILLDCTRRRKSECASGPT